MLKHHAEQTKRFVEIQINKGGAYAIETKESSLGGSTVTINNFKRGIFSLYIPYSVAKPEIKQEIDGIIGEVLADNRDRLFKEANELIRLSQACGRGHG